MVNSTGTLGRQELTREMANETTFRASHPPASGRRCSRHLTCPNIQPATHSRARQEATPHLAQLQTPVARLTADHHVCLSQIGELTCLNGSVIGLVVPVVPALKGVRNGWVGPGIRKAPASCEMTNNRPERCCILPGLSRYLGTMVEECRACGRNNVGK